MKIGTILTATDSNPLYSEFIPSFIQAWSRLLPEADICIVYIADELPEQFAPYAKHIQLVKPIQGIHTAFQAQCIRLLYPRFLTRDEGVLITDMDMLPLSRSYYVDSIYKYADNAFVVYRDVCLPAEICICYNVAHPSTWKSVFGEKPTEELLAEWYSSSLYDGTHGGKGWGTDQQILIQRFHAWSGKKIILNDRLTGFRRLCRSEPALFQKRDKLQKDIQAGVYADYHCLRPYSQHKEINDFITDCL